MLWCALGQSQVPTVMNGPISICWGMVFGSVLPRPARLLVLAHARFRIYEGSMQ
jgi:hypothetical protein